MKFKKNVDKQTDAEKRPLKTTAILGVKEGLIPFLIQFAVLVVVILEFAFIIANPIFPSVTGVPLRQDEANNPNIMRLVYMCVAIPVTAALVLWAVRIKENKRAFWVALIAGIVAWQCIGECSWHFGLPVGDAFVFFPKIEGVQGTFLLLLFVPCTIYLLFSKQIKWGIKIFALSFLCNWIGHWLILGPASWFPQAAALNPHVWEKIAGYAFGLGGTLVLSYRMFFKAKTAEERLILSLLMYTAVGMFVEGVFGIGASLE